MQREHRHLDAQPDDDECDSSGQRPVSVEVREPLRQIGHVERAGDGVGETDPDQQERRPDGADDQVPERGEQRPAPPAHRDQRVGRQGCDLEEHERVEGVTGGGDAEHPGQAETHAGVEERDSVGLDLQLHARSGVDRDDERDRRDQRQHRCVHRVDHVLDAGRCRPAPERVPQHLALRHPPGQQERADQRP